MGEAGAGGGDDSLGEDDELDVADDGDAAPGHRSGPECGMVGHAAGCCGEVGVGCGEQVEGDVRGEYVWGKRGGEKAWEAGLEGLKCCGFQQV